MRWAAPLVGLLAFALLLAPFAVVPAQAATLTMADSALVGRILRAEDRRDSSDRAVDDGVRSNHALIRLLALRARARIAEPQFASRDSFPAAVPAPIWPEPAWRHRYRALAAGRDDCAVLRRAVADSAWPVRLHAADVARASCAGDDALAATLRKWVDALPGDASRRSSGGVSWHAAAHALVALARLRPDDARSRLHDLATHRQWQARMYATRAAAELSDTATLQLLARDADDNVKEAAIDALARLSGHENDDIFLGALGANGAQAVRAAALALVGSPRAGVRTAASATFERWVARDDASARDVRLALLQAAGRPASDDRPPVDRPDVPWRAVALALGEQPRLRVTIAPASGGGSFVVRLRGDVAPITAARILELVHDGYYDGLTWQRVEPDFVIQGGSPGANEYVGHRRYFRDELGTLPHGRGTVGMSTRGHDTGDGQWFVNLRDNPRLGRDYTVFAEVIDGIDVVDGILEGDTIASIREIR